LIRQAIEPSIELWLSPVTRTSVLGHEDAEAGEPVTSIHAATIVIAQRIFLDRGTSSASSAHGQAQQPPCIFSRTSFTAACLALALLTL
jgi:hypothetical protein